jgi:tRNA pseudouridine38-40 synthase
MNPQMDRTIRLTLAYDGTDFLGWQEQASGRTVQGVVEASLAEVHGHPVGVVGAGRTDSGVHATGQVAHFHSDRASIPAGRFRDAINAHLPHDVRVLESREADAGFHARRSAVLRVYRYYLAFGPVWLPHLRGHCWWLRRRPEVDVLDSMAGALVGRHDFTSFCCEGDASGSRIRALQVSSFHAEAGGVIYTAAANAFLWKMVRTIVGTCLALEERGADADAVREILEARDRSLAAGTAPARGLFLERVIYDGESGIAV